MPRHLVISPPRHPGVKVPFGGIDFRVPAPGSLGVPTLTRGVELRAELQTAKDVGDPAVEAEVLARAHSYVLERVREKSSPDIVRKLEQMTPEEARDLIENVLDHIGVRFSRQIAPAFVNDLRRIFSRWRPGS